MSIIPDAAQRFTPSKLEGVPNAVATGAQPKDKEKFNRAVAICTLVEQYIPSAAQIIAQEALRDGSALNDTRIFARLTVDLSESLAEEHLERATKRLGEAMK